MVKVIGNVLPAEWEVFWKKCVRWYGLKGIPTFSRLWFQDIPRMKSIRHTISDFKLLADAWQLLPSSERTLWNNAAQECWEYNRGYRLFTADYIYRMIAGLELPGTPSEYHQLFGLQILNPEGASNVFLRRDDKDLVGPLNFTFKFRKDELAASPTYAFKVQCTAYYFTEGYYATDVDEYVAPGGNIAWNETSRDFGTAGRKYFHFKVVLTIENYNARIYLDSVKLSDSVGVAHFENFITERNKAWVPKMLYRKRDWAFGPEYAEPYFKHLYLT